MLSRPSTAVPPRIPESVRTAVRLSVCCIIVEGVLHQSGHHIASEREFGCDRVISWVALVNKSSVVGVVSVDLNQTDVEDSLDSQTLLLPAGVSRSANRDSSDVFQDVSFNLSSKQCRVSVRAPKQRMQEVGLRVMGTF